jgi:hypothetical protein
MHHMCPYEEVWDDRGQHLTLAEGAVFMSGLHNCCHGRWDASGYPGDREQLENLRTTLQQTYVIFEGLTADTM